MINAKIANDLEFGPFPQSLGRKPPNSRSAFLYTEISITKKSAYYPNILVTYENQTRTENWALFDRFRNIKITSLFLIISNKNGFWGK